MFHDGLTHPGARPYEALKVRGDIGAPDGLAGSARRPCRLPGAAWDKWYRATRMRRPIPAPIATTPRSYRTTCPSFNRVYTTSRWP